MPGSPAYSPVCELHADRAGRTSSGVDNAVCVFLSR